MKQWPLWFMGRTNATSYVGKCTFLFHEASGCAKVGLFSGLGKLGFLVWRDVFIANARVSTSGRTTGSNPHGAGVSWGYADFHSHPSRTVCAPICAGHFCAISILLSSCMTSSTHWSGKRAGRSGRRAIGSAPGQRLFCKRRRRSLGPVPHWLT